MATENQIVISASRRTDIPAFYMAWFMAQVRNRVFEAVNPFNQKKRVIPATPAHVHTIVFWSKNFGPFLQGGFGETLQEMGYHLFFNFTINSDSPLLEPGVPRLEERLEQLDGLCSRFDARAIHWRFDPICFYTNQDKQVHTNMNDFLRIADRAAENGVRRCITSFMDHYPKIKKRTAALTGFSFIDPAVEDKVAVLGHMEDELAERGLGLSLCCEKELMAALPAGTTIRESSCIPNHDLVTLFGGRLSLAKDKGQRVNNGCGCRVSVDIGTYRQHPCFHNCLFCYANPTAKPKPNTTLEQ